MRLTGSVCLLPLFSCVLWAASPQFSARQDTATGFTRLSGLVTADFNGDGRPDIALTDSSAKRVVVYLANANGTLSAPVSTNVQFPAVGAGQMVTGDFNEDGKQDILLSTIAGAQSTILLTGNGDGTFTQQATLPNSFGFVSGQAIDVNHDSHLDLIQGGNPGLSLYLGDGKGGFTAQSFANQGTQDLVVALTAADFNLDKNIDLVVGGYLTNSLRFFAGAGNGTFSAPVTIPQTAFYSPNSFATGDFNQDGKLDLLIGSADIATVVFGNGDGSFQSSNARIVILPLPQPPANVTNGIVTVAAADMNGDGIVDVVAIDSSTNTLNVFINDGTGNFPQSAPDFTVSVPAGSGQLALADLNGDGLPDVVLGNYLNEKVSVFLSIRSKTVPAVSLISNSNLQLAGTPLTFTGRVTGTPNLPPTGTVMLLDGTTPIGQQTLNASGQASFMTSSLSTAVHPLTLSYAGDANYLPATSAVVSQSVTDFQVALPTPSQSVSRGSTATYTLGLTPLSGFAGSITFSCSGLPATSSCTSTPTTLSGQPASATISVTTTPASNLARPPMSAGPGRSILLGLLSVSLCFLMRRRRLRHFAFVSVAAIVFTSLTGCGNSNQPSSPANPGSPSGSTAFTITAASTLGTQTVTHQVSATLVVN